MWISLRPLTLILTTLETLIALFYIAVFHEPGRSNAITNIVVDSLTLIIASLWLVFVLPAMVLAIRNTRLKLAFALALLAIPATAASFVIL